MSRTMQTLRLGSLLIKQQSQQNFIYNFARFYASAEDLLKTPLYDFHVSHGAKMVPFAGWAMPIQYKDTIMDSAVHCRKSASIFDVSHMLGVTIKGPQAVPFLERMVVGDVQGLEDGTSLLSLIMTPKGTVLDDTVLSKISDEEVYLVVNAGNREKDINHMQNVIKDFPGASLDIHADRCVVALQGPKAAAALQPYVKQDLSSMYFGHFKKIDINGVPSFLARTGYTGEDGFELSLPGDKTEAMLTEFLKNSDVKLAGLGARDSLRLEAGLCLYGNDVTEDTTPVEAKLKWTIGKRRQVNFDFIGGDKLKAAWNEPTKRSRVGITSNGPPARQHSVVKSVDGEVVGEVTSGAYSPNLKCNVGMAYINKPFDKLKTDLKVVVRGKEYDAKVTKMPFIPNNYYRKE